MGVAPKDAVVEFEEGFIRIAYDFKVSPANKKCLFNVFEAEDTKFSRWASETNNKFKFTPA